MLGFAPHTPTAPAPGAPPDRSAEDAPPAADGPPASARAPVRRWHALQDKRDLVIAVVASVGIVVHLILRFGTPADPAVRPIPLLIVLAVGGVPLVIELGMRLSRRQSDAIGISARASPPLAAASPIVVIDRTTAA